MRKEQRKIYIELAGEVNFLICAFCKYSECISGDSPCDCGESYCIHPLADRLEGQCGAWPYGIESGCDCWGFRPAHDVSFCADVVGICLENKWEGAVWWQNKKGQWRIAEALI